MKMYYTIKCTYEGTGNIVVFRMEWFLATLRTAMLISGEESLRESPGYDNSRVLALGRHQCGSIDSR